MNRIFRAASMAFWIAAASVIAGCATNASTKMPKDVEARALKRWELLIAHKPDEAYAYLTPGFRATKSKEDYTREMLVRPVAWKAVKPFDKSCEEDTCTIRLMMDFTVPMPNAPQAGGFSIQQEKWIRVSKDWFYLPDQMGASPTGKGLH